MFMRWQLAEVAAGRVRRGNVGGQAWTLPAKSKRGKPAALPATVVAFCATWIEHDKARVFISTGPFV